MLAWLAIGGVTLAPGTLLAAPPGAAGATRSAPGRSESDGRTMTAESAEHRTMRGEVRRINEERGTLTLRTGEGDLDLHLSPSAVRGIHKGDRVTVRLTVSSPAVTGTRPATPGRAAGAHDPPGPGKGAAAPKP